MNNQRTRDEVWETHALWWRESFACGVDEEYELQILPLTQEYVTGASCVLDIGTGEGQISRAIKDAGVGCVIGLDSSQRMLELAAELADDKIAYVRGDLTSLPFPDGAFDAITISLVLEHVDALNVAVAEISRVLKPNGRVLLFLNHPAFQTPDSGWIDDQILDEQYWRTGPYLPEQTTMESIDSEVSIAFRHRPISTYVNHFSSVGIYIENMIEPAPPVTEEYPEASTIPRLLFLVMRKM